MFFLQLKGSEASSRDHSPEPWHRLQGLCGWPSATNCCLCCYTGSRRTTRAVTRLPLPLEPSVGVSSDACSLQLSMGSGSFPALAPACALSCLVELGDGFLRASAAPGGKRIPLVYAGRAGSCALAALARPATPVGGERPSPLAGHRRDRSRQGPRSLRHRFAPDLLQTVRHPWVL